MIETVVTFLSVMIFLFGTPMIISYVIWWVLKMFKVKRFSLHQIFFFSILIWGGIILAISIFFWSPQGMSPKNIPLPLPSFPWPPPPASAETMIPRNWLSTMEATQLTDVANRLEHALKEAKYRRWSYSSVPNGFALVSQMEQIKSDGTPSPEPARWSTDLPWITNMTLFEFIKALARAPSGYYRVIVFIVTNQPWSRPGEKPTGREAERWLAKGFNWLPQSIGKLTYEPDYRTTALVYEFQKVSRDTDATFLEPSLISADDHLKKAGLSDPLSRR